MMSYLTKLEGDLTNVGVACLRHGSRLKGRQKEQHSQCHVLVNPPTGNQILSTFNPWDCYRQVRKPTRANKQKDMKEDLAERLREVLLNGTWIANTNFKEQITSTSWKQAVQKVENLNTIALLTFHINYYVAGVLQVFEGGNLEIRDKYSFDMPEIQSEADWNKLVNEFVHNAEKLIHHIENMDEHPLNAPFVKAEYGSYRRNIEAQIEHSYYHLGQVVLIRKMLLQKQR